MKRFVSVTCFLAMVLAIQVGFISAQTTEFTYQGQLQNSSAPANGNYDFEFLLFDSLTGGTQIGTSLTRSSVAVSAGTFAVKLDFGASFPGANRFLEIRVRTAGGGAYTPLAPRQIVNSSPYAVKAANAENAVNAATATNATQLGGVAANQYVITTDPRMSDARAPIAGSSNYIQNQNAAAQSGNFKIDGNGTVGGTFAATALNVTVGVNASSIDISSPFGYRIGGVIAFSMTNCNTTAGNQAGLFNSGTCNSFYGQNTGRQSSTGNNNSFFGAGAGYLNAGGNDNSFFGLQSGNNSQGSRNSFFGVNAGIFNQGGNSNTLIGHTSATVGVLTNATAIGANSQVNQNNSLVLGSINGVNGATADTNVGIGTTTPANRLHVNGAVRITNGGIFIANPNTVVITSPNGLCWGITVGNTGALSTFPVSPCP